MCAYIEPPPSCLLPLVHYYFMGRQEQVGASEYVLGR